MKLYGRLIVEVLLASWLRVPAAIAQGTREDYQRAEQFLPGNLRHKLYVAEMEPHPLVYFIRSMARKGAIGMV